MDKRIKSIKKEIHEYIDKADDRFIKLVYGMIVAEKEDLFMRYDKKDLVARAELSEKDVKTGKTIKAADLKTEFENWKKKKAAHSK